MTTSYTNQVAFRGRTGDTAGLNADADWAALQNTNFSAQAGTTLRVRFEVQEENSKNALISGQLEQNFNAGGWVNVTTSSSNVRAVASGQFNEDDVTTDLLTASAKTFTGGYGSEDGLATNVAINNTHTEFEYCVELLTAGSLQLRLAGLDNWAATLTITVTAATVTGTFDNTLGTLATASTSQVLVSAVLDDLFSTLLLDTNARAEITATFNKTFGTLTLDAQGKRIIQGAFDNVLDDLTLESAGNVVAQATAVLDAALEGLSLDTAAKAYITATFNKTLADLTLAALGVTQNFRLATFDKTLGELTANTSGGVLVAGTFDKSLGTLSLDTAASVVNTVAGTAGVTFATLTLVTAATVTAAVATGYTQSSVITDDLRRAIKAKDEVFYA